MQKCNITSRVNIGHVPTPFPSIPNLRVSQTYWPDEDTITSKSQITDYLFRTRLWRIEVPMQPKGQALEITSLQQLML